MVGAEGLVRCRHPVLGVLTPASFLPQATEQGLNGLTEHVVAKALTDWDEITPPGFKLHVAVNTTVGALANLQLPSIIREHRPRRENWPGLILEITESEVIRDVRSSTRSPRSCASTASPSPSTTSARASPRSPACASSPLPSSSST